MSVLSKLTFKLSAVPVKTPSDFFEGIKWIPKFTWKCKIKNLDICISKILKMNKVKRLIVPDFKTDLMLR